MSAFITAKRGEKNGEENNPITPIKERTNKWSNTSPNNKEKQYNPIKKSLIIKEIVLLKERDIVSNRLPSIK